MLSAFPLAIFFIHLPNRKFPLLQARDVRPRRYRCALFKREHAYLLQCALKTYRVDSLCHWFDFYTLTNRIDFRKHRLEHQLIESIFANINSFL